jgi:hypothetical protein
MTQIETRARYAAGTLRGLLLGSTELRSATSPDDVVGYARSGRY